MLKLPEDSVALQRLHHLGVSARDRVETLAARPDPHHHPELWRQLQRCRRAHGAIHGTSGIGRFGQWCPPLRFRGAEYGLGRLAYDRGRGELPNGDTSYLLNVHVPSGDPLTTESCDSSFQQALDFFGRHFPDEPVSSFVCHSWLLDPQLAEYLPADSNIVRFQRRFELKQLAQSAVYDVCDTDVLRYVFGKAIDGPEGSDDLLDSLPLDTTMRRAFTTHLRSGRHWYRRTGWISLSRCL